MLGYMPMEMLVCRPTRAECGHVAVHTHSGVRWTARPQSCLLNDDGLSLLHVAALI